MGVFSWITSDTKRSISCYDSDRGSFPVYLVTPDNDYILEENYDGYGEFGGFDVFALVAKWNRPEQCNGDIQHDRLIGIDIACTDKDNAALKYPLKFAEEKIPYDQLEASKRCPQQGYFYEY